MHARRRSYPPAPSPRPDETPAARIHAPSPAEPERLPALRIHISWIRMIKSILFLLSVTLLSGANPDPKTEKEVLAALDAYKQGLMKKDATTLSKILSDDLTYSHSSNLHENKAAVLESLKGNTVAEAIDFKNLKVRVYGNTALVKGDVDFRNNTAGVVS